MLKKRKRKIFYSITKLILDNVVVVGTAEEAEVILIQMEEDSHLLLITKAIILNEIFKMMVIYESNTTAQHFLKRNNTNSKNFSAIKLITSKSLVKFVENLIIVLLIVGIDLIILISQRISRVPLLPLL